MIINLGRDRKIKNNEIRALFFIEKNLPFKAEKILLKNLISGTANTMTYDLLIRIYHERNDYPSLIKILDLAIKKTLKNGFYRDVKKQAVLSWILTDIEFIEPSSWLNA